MTTLICSWRAALERQSFEKFLAGGEERKKEQRQSNFHYFWSRPDGYITEVHREKCAKVPDSSLLRLLNAMKVNLSFFFFCIRWKDFLMLWIGVDFAASSWSGSAQCLKMYPNVLCDNIHENHRMRFILVWFQRLCCPYFWWKNQWSINTFFCIRSRSCCDACCFVVKKISRLKSSQQPMR